MSVRIYQLSKQLGLDNKQVIALLRERGFDVDSPSNTIPNIYADSLLEELGKKSEAEASSDQEETPAETEVQAEEVPAPREVEPMPVADVVPEKQPEVAPAKTAPVPPMPAMMGKAAPTVSLRVGAPEPVHPRPMPQAPQMSPTAGGVRYVRSAAEIENERKDKQAPKSAPTPMVPVRVAPPPSLAQPPVVRAPIPAAPLTAGSAPRVTISPMGARPAPVPTLSQPLAQMPSQAPVKSPDGVIRVKPPIVVRDFANLINIKPFRLISELMEMGVFASMHQTIEEGIALKVAERHGIALEIHHRGEAQAAKEMVQAKKKAEEAYSEPRPPVVCILGHVDHGKTTLLDTIRKTNVVAGEAGGITQHIGAYQVEHLGKKITFIDTPGHAAFSKMRQRGASVTDIAILVVAADDGFMPQTDEALKFIQKENVPIIVAINKMDAKGANVDRVKQQMQQRGIAPEEWGGETLCTPISALKGAHIDELLNQVLLQSEMEELAANPKATAEGVVIESQIDVGRGPVASVIVQNGTLRVGDALVAGACHCKVRSLIDDKGKTIKEALPSTPVRVMGWSNTPDAGGAFITVKNEKEAKILAEEHAQAAKQEAGAVTEKPASKPASGLESLMAAIASTKQKVLRVIVKGDVNGSVEALTACLNDIKSTKVALEVLQSEVGPISKNDITLAHAAQATVVGFNTKMENGVMAIAKHHSVRILQHNIIYELITQVKEAMAELLDPEVRENKVGSAQVRQVFSLSKGAVAGCMVTEGRITREAQVRLIRGTERLHEGRIGALKRFKDDVTEVKAGYECGIQINGCNAYQNGDTIECFELIKIYPSL